MFNSGFSIDVIVEKITKLEPSHGDIRVKLTNDFFVWKDEETTLCLAKYDNPEFHVEFDLTLPNEETGQLFDIRHALKEMNKLYISKEQHGRIR